MIASPRTLSEIDFEPANRRERTGVGFPRLLRVLGFLILPMASIASPLLALPAVTSKYGAPAWVAVAVGQSVGGALAVVVELAWSLTGPQRVARLDVDAGRRVLATALLSKFLLFLPLAVLGAAVSSWLSAVHGGTSALVAVGATATGLTSIWYYIGRGSVGKIFKTDALPRLLCVSGASAMILLGAPLWTYPVIGIILPGLGSVFATLYVERMGLDYFRGISFARICHVIKVQSIGMSGRALSGLYIALPVALVSMVAPGAVAVFAAAERLQRICLQMLDGIPSVMQNWVGGASSRLQRHQRVQKAIVYNIWVGLISGAGFSMGAGIASRYVFAGSVDLPLQITLISGVLVFVVCISKATGNLALVALGRVKVITLSALAGAIVGIPAIMVGAWLHGAPGALLAEVAAEMVVLAIQAVYLVITLRRLKNKPPADAPVAKSMVQSDHQG